MKDNILIDDTAWYDMLFCRPSKRSITFSPFFLVHADKVAQRAKTAISVNIIFFIFFTSIHLINKWIKVFIGKI